MHPRHEHRDQAGERRRRARKLYAEGTYSHRQIAKIMGMSNGGIQKYLAGMKRRKVEEEVVWPVDGISFRTSHLHAKAYWPPNRNPRASWHAPR